jgi:8-oxo-dGTP diphosphatase
MTFRRSSQCIPMIRTVVRDRVLAVIPVAVYFALVDDDPRCVMLVDHLKAQAWLLPGGHVDDGEDPRWSVEREAFEELQITPKFHERLGGGQLKGDVTAEIRPDPHEFSEVRWYSLDDQTDWSADCFDPHMQRFVAKLKGMLDSAVRG